MTQPLTSAGTRPCTCNRIPAPGTLFRLGEHCRECWLWHHNVRRQRLTRPRVMDDAGASRAEEEMHAHQDTTSHPDNRNARNVVAEGPGTELKSLLESLGLSGREGCGCEVHVIQMDAWGVEGCEQHRDEILVWLRQAQQRMGWRDRIRAALGAVRTGLALHIDLLDPAPGLLDQAIRRSRERRSKREEESPEEDGYHSNPSHLYPCDAQMVVTADGVGDHIRGLAVAATWRRNNPGKRLAFVVRPSVMRWVRLFDEYDVLTTSQFPSPDVPLVNDFSRRGGLHYVEACQRAPSIPPGVRPLPAHSRSWAEPHRGSVVLSPWAGFVRKGSPGWAINNRVWMMSHWLALEALLNKHGIPTVIIDTDHRRNENFSGEKLTGRTPEQVASLMQVSRCVVSNESGMAHLAGALGVPCVVLSSLLDGPAIHAVWQRTRVLEGSLGCARCRWTGPNWHHRCNTLCANLQSIQPDEVFRAVLGTDTLNHQPAAVQDTDHQVTWYMVTWVRSPGVTGEVVSRPLSPLATSPSPVPVQSLSLRRDRGLERQEGEVFVSRTHADGMSFDEMTARVDRVLHGNSGSHRLFGRMFEYLRGVPTPVVVETGCVRSPDDWSAGYFGYVVGQFLQEHGGHLYSIDNDAGHVAFARERLGVFKCVEVIHSDGHEWLDGYRGEPINLLYLDSQDIGTDGYQECCLAEALTADEHMSTKVGAAMIVIDDTWIHNGIWFGKGEIAVPWLLEGGWQVLESGHQVLLVRKN